MARETRETDERKKGGKSPSFLCGLRYLLFLFGSGEDERPSFVLFISVLPFLFPGERPCDYCGLRIEQKIAKVAKNKGNTTSLSFLRSLRFLLFPPVRMIRAAGV